MRTILTLLCRTTHTLRHRMLSSIPERRSICVRHLYSFLFSLVCGVFLVPLPFGERAGMKALNPVTYTGRWGGGLQTAPGINAGAKG